jgi:hypothetical protein
MLMRPKHPLVRLLTLKARGALDLMGSFTFHSAEEMPGDVGIPGARPRSRIFYSFATAAAVSGGKRSSPMRIMNANTLSGFSRKSAESVSDFAGVVRNLILDVRDSYRPEVHYMRGPGPKWHAKHQSRLRFDSEAVPAGGRHELSPVCVRPHD